MSLAFLLPLDDSQTVLPNRKVTEPTPHAVLMAKENDSEKTGVEANFSESIQSPSTGTGYQVG